MKNLGDSIFSGTIVGMILGIPIFIGIGILAIPILVISCITDIPMSILLKNLIAFAIAIFLVWLFSQHQIIENGLVGLIVGSLVHTHFKWHSLICILIGITLVGLLFFISYIKIGFWIKTIPFSIIVTFFVYAFIYSDGGLFPLPDMIWKIAFIIIFFLENIFIRCAVAYNNGFLFGDYTSSKKRKSSDYKENQTDATKETSIHNEEQSNNFWFAGINSAEELKKRYKELMKIYHPDNQAGDTNAVQQIQDEYKKLLQKY